MTRWITRWRCCTSPLLAAQLEKEKFNHFFIMMQVPQKVVSYLAQVSQRGYDQMRLQLSNENAKDADDDDGRSQEDEDEVGQWDTPHMCCRCRAGCMHFPVTSCVHWSA